MIVPLSAPRIDRRHRRFLVAATLALVVALAGCGGNQAAVKTVTVEHEVPSAPRGTASGLDAITPPSAPKPTSRARQIAFLRCDANIKAKKSTTTCGFANNAFYEYSTSTNADAIRVYSPAVSRYYSTRCAHQDGQVECTTRDGGEVRFSQAAVDRYTQAEADAYAAHADRGPDPAGPAAPSVGGGTPAAAPTPLPEPPADPSPVAPQDFCATHDCIPNYPNGNGSTVQCADGTFSQSGGIQGACSHHGGVG